MRGALATPPDLGSGDTAFDSRASDHSAEGGVDTAFVERFWGCRRSRWIPGIVGADGSWCVPVTVWCWWAAAPC